MTNFFADWPRGAYRDTRGAHEGGEGMGERGEGARGEASREEVESRRGERE